MGRLRVPHVSRGMKQKNREPGPASGRNTAGLAETETSATSPTCTRRRVRDQQEPLTRLLGQLGRQVSGEIETLKRLTAKVEAEPNRLAARRAVPPIRHSR